MQILLTGAAGFIGSATAQELARRGYKVLAIDNFSPYYSKALKEQRVNSLLHDSLIEFRICDLAQAEQVNNLFQNSSITSVVHLAAQAGVRIPISDWGKYTRENLQAFSNILVASVQNNVRSFLYASSSSVYGNSAQSSFSETSTHPSPVSFYGATKFANEIMAKTVSQNVGIKTRGLRFFTVYGPWGRPDMVYFRMIASAISQRPFEFFGDGTIERDFTYISDVADIVCSLLEEIIGRSDSFSDVVNIGGGRPRSINEILGIIRQISGRNIPFIQKGADIRDVSKTNADFGYLRSLVGKYPSVETYLGLETTYEWASQLPDMSLLNDWVSSVT